MNTIIIAYLFYTVITFLIILKVGHVLYKSGAVYLEELIASDLELAHSINKVLLVGYYLMNLGYVLLNINSVGGVTNLAEMFEIVSRQIAYIVLAIAGIHYTNLLWMYLLSQYLKRKSMFNQKS